LLLLLICQLALPGLLRLTLQMNCSPLLLLLLLRDRVLLPLSLIHYLTLALLLRLPEHHLLRQLQLQLAMLGRLTRADVLTRQIGRRARPHDVRVIDIFWQALEELPHGRGLILDGRSLLLLLLPAATIVQHGAQSGQAVPDLLLMAQLLALAGYRGALPLLLLLLEELSRHQLSAVLASQLLQQRSSLSGVCRNPKTSSRNSPLTAELAPDELLSLQILLLLLPNLGGEVLQRLATPVPSPGGPRG